MSGSDVNAPNLNGETISDKALLRGFILALSAGGRKQKLLTVYEDSIRMLSDFSRGLGPEALATMDRNVVRYWLASLHQKGNKPATVTGRYRSLNRFFARCVTEYEVLDNPMDRLFPTQYPMPREPFCSQQ